MKQEKISRKTFDSLPEYSCSLPTLQTIGKVWKRNLNFWVGGEPDWIICEYVECEDKKFVGLDYRKLIIIE